MMCLKVKEKMSESMTAAVLLTLAGGFQDAYSYNSRGMVFANAQTGNVALLAQNLSQGNIRMVLRYLVPLAAFFCGICVTEWLQTLGKKFNGIHWRQKVLILEMGILILVGFLPQSMNAFANALMSFSCAMQVNSFRKFNGIACATTMCIGNFRTATEMLCKYHFTKDQEAKRKCIHCYFIILIFGIGAAFGGLLSTLVKEQAIWTAASILFLSILMMLGQEESESVKSTSQACL
mgnify:CR=1 FL=1